MIRNALVLVAIVAAAPALAAEEPPAKSVQAQDCLLTRSIQQGQAGPDRKWYARMRDGSWWRNAMECPGLAPRRALVHSSPIGSQCRGDIVQVIDYSIGGVFFGGCGLGSWDRVPGLPGKADKRKG